MRSSRFNFLTNRTGLKNLAIILWLIVVFVLLTWAVYTFLPVHVDWKPNGPFQIGVDWKGTFQPAALRLLQGQNPYVIRCYQNPPWVLLPLIPIALFPPPMGSAIIFVVNLFAYVYVLMRLKIHPLLLIPFVFISGMLTNSGNGNIDGLVALGYLMPAQWGLFFVLTKPQIGIAVAAFWAVEAWRDGGVKQVVKTFLPVVVAYLLSFLIFGLWFKNSFNNPSVETGGVFFPYAVPVGIFLLGMSIWKRKVEYAIPASPFFSPYLGGPSWAIIFLGGFAMLSWVIPKKLLPEKWINSIQRKKEKNPDIEGPEALEEMSS